jgi:uncharacterized sporulation protein YeaH/YhbH (DUF444 family)
VFFVHNGESLQPNIPPKREQSTPVTDNAFAGLALPPRDELPLAAMRVPDSGISIDGDVERFRDIVKGKAHQELQKHLENGEQIIEKEDGTFSLPVPQIEQPRFKHGSNEKGGAGEGSGQQGPAQKGSQPGPAGDQPGQHPIELNVSIDELTAFLGEELGLPRIQPKGRREIESEGQRFTSVARQGPNALKIFKRSFKEALIREAASGTYDPNNPIVVPIRDDLRYRTTKPHPQPVDNAVIIHLMDVSGSMGEEQKGMARAISFWTDTWIAGHYKQAVHVYIAHDTDAKVVDKETYYNQREDGGTKISAGYEKIVELLHTTYPPEQWNLYLFQYSDGDNLSTSDSQRCIEILQNDLLPHLNLFAYGQVKAQGTTGDFIKSLRDSSLKGDEKVVIQDIPSKRAIKRVIQEFLKKGR